MVEAYHWRRPDTHPKGMNKCSIEMVGRITSIIRNSLTTT